MYTTLMLTIMAKGFDAPSALCKNELWTNVFTIRCSTSLICTNEYLPDQYNRLTYVMIKVRYFDHLNKEICFNATDGWT